MLDRAVDHVTTWGELILALGGAFMALWYGAKRVYNIAKTVDLVLEAVETTGRQASEALAEIKLVKHQVFPNGGGSLADQVAEIKQRVQVLEHGGYADHPVK